jgi:hypothetical protein
MPTGSFMDLPALSWSVFSPYEVYAMGIPGSRTSRRTMPWRIVSVVA